MTNCPISPSSLMITLTHGNGGRLTSQLIDELFLPAFDCPELKELHDGARLSPIHSSIIMSTDSFVMDPRSIPGADLGKLAVIGTANDLAMCGSRPLYLSCGFIIEEGIELTELQQLVSSMQKAAIECNVKIVTGDTKVIERTPSHNLFINTTGIGQALTTQPISPSQIQPGDLILLSGDIGRHGMAVMAHRHQLQFSHPLQSDCAPLFPFVERLLAEGITIHCMRDITRGGLASAIIELSEASGYNIELLESAIPIIPSVESACEILGIDPLFVASEGRCIFFIPSHQSSQALTLLQRFQEGKLAQIIGEVQSKPFKQSFLRNRFGITRPLYKLHAEQLPRIC